MTGEMVVDDEDGPIDGTIPAEYGEERDSYIYQYEEAGDSETADTETSHTERSDESSDTQPQDREAEDRDAHDGETMDHDYYDYESQYPQSIDYEAQSEEIQSSEPQDQESMETEETDSQNTEPQDIEVQDAEAPDSEAQHTEVQDTEPQDIEVQDAEAPDSEAQVTEVQDTEVQDTEVQDTEPSDAEAQDSEAQDTEAQDTEAQDTEAQDTEAQDTEAQDAEAQDAEAQDTDTMDYETMEYYESQDDDSTNTTQCTEADGYGYTYALPEDIYGSSIDPPTDIVAVEELMKQPWDDSSQNRDDQYAGSPYTTEYPGEFANNERLALYTWDLAELLTWSDQETLRVLAAVSDGECGVRRAVLSDYLECLGLEATVLANRFEEESGLAVLALVDDLAQTAAFLACFRLAERGELESDEALALLQKSLLHRSDRWNRWIGEVIGEESDISRTDDVAQPDTAQPNTAQPDTSTTSLVLRAVVLTAAGSLERIGDAISGLSRQMKNLY